MLDFAGCSNSATSLLFSAFAGGFAVDSYCPLRAQRRRLLDPGTAVCHCPASGSGAAALLLRAGACSNCSCVFG